jgi:circadian clock protein KaiC
MKARGMSHSNQIREFLVTDHGVKVVEAYIGPDGVMTGLARLTQEARAQAATAIRAQDIERRQRQVTRRRDALQRQIAELQAVLDSEEDEQQTLIAEDVAREACVGRVSDVLSARRVAVE